LKTLHELFEDGLKDMYNAEKQLIKALPKMVKMAKNSRLKQGFENHLRETESHAQRVEMACATLGIKPSGMVCRAMKGLIEEGSEWMEEDAEPEVMDASLIAAAQRVEHYEIAGYGCVRTYAQLLGNEKAARLLQQTLDEEGKTDKLLTDLAAAYMGFGVFLANTAFAFKQWRDDALGTQGWRTRRHLPETDLVFATAIFFRAKNLNPDDRRSCLKSHLAKEFDRALRDLDAREADIERI